MMNAALEIRLREATNPQGEMYLIFNGHQLQTNLCLKGIAAYWMDQMATLNPIPALQEEQESLKKQIFQLQSKIASRDPFFEGVGKLPCVIGFQNKTRKWVQVRGKRELGNHFYVDQIDIQVPEMMEPAGISKVTLGVEQRQIRIFVDGPFQNMDLDQTGLTPHQREKIRTAIRCAVRTFWQHLDIYQLFCAELGVYRQEVQRLTAMLPPPIRW